MIGIAWPLLVLLVLVVCSFLVSGSETALFALSARDRRKFTASPSRLKRLASSLMSRPRRVLMTVLIANTTVNVAIFAVSYITFGRWGEGNPAAAAVGGAVMLIVVIFFGEVVPKAVAMANARRIAPIVAPLIHALQIVTTPVRELLRIALVGPITQLLSPSSARVREVSSADLSNLVEMSAEQGIISSREHDMLQAVVSMPEIKVRSVMVPRTEIESASIHAPMDDVIRVFQETGLKKLPVYGRDLDDIRGLVYARDVYLQSNRPLRSLIQSVHYVPEIINLLQLTRHFRSTRTQLAIVVDEYGGVSGLVTLEDLLEEIVGDIDRAGRVSPEPTVERIDQNTYRLPGSLSVRPWRQFLGIAGMFPQVETIGGVVLASLGRLPRAGDKVHLKNLEITVDQLEGLRIDRVVLRVLPASPQPDAMKETSTS